MKEVDEKVVEEAEVKKEKPVYIPDPKYVEIAQKVDEMQGAARVRLVNVMNSAVNQNTNFNKALKIYTDAIRQYVSESQDPEAMELLNTLDDFNEKTANIADMDKATLGEDVDQKTADDYFYSKNGFRDTFLAIKRFKANHKSPLDLVSKSEAICEGFDIQIGKSFGQALKRNEEFDNTVCYIAKNSGDFNIAEGEELLEGVANVSAAYQLIRKQEHHQVNVTSNFEHVADIFGAEARKIRKNQTFKKYFTDSNTKKLNINIIEQTVKNRNEWETSEAIRLETIAKRKKKEEERKKLEEEQKKLREEQEKNQPEENKDNNNNQKAVEEENRKIKEEIAKEFEVMSKEDVQKVIDSDEDDFFESFDPVEPVIDVNVKRGLSEKERKAAEKAKEWEIRSKIEEAKAPDFDAKEQAVMYGNALVHTLDNISSELKAFKKEFLNAQVDKTANSGEGAAKEGPDDYQKILKNIDTLIADIDNKQGNVTLGGITGQIETLFKNVNTYRKDHRPRIRGHRSAESAERYEIMNRLSDKGFAYRDTLNSLAKDIIKAEKEAGDKNPTIKDKFMPDLQVGLSIKYNITDAEKLHGIHDRGNELADELADYRMFMNERDKYIKRILRAYSKNEPFFDVEGYYNSIEEVDTENDLRSAFEEPKPIINQKHASLSDLAKAGVIMRDLKDLKTKGTTISELKALLKKVEKREYEKEIDSLFKGNGYRIDMEIASITGIEDKLDLSERLVRGMERKTKGMAGIADDFNTLSAKELQNKYLKSYGHCGISENLAYNIATAKVLGKPENAHILYQYCSITNYYNEDKLEEGAKKRIKRDVIEYVKKSGIVEQMRKEGKSSLDHVPEFNERLNDPQFLSGLVKVLDKSTKREMERCLPVIRENAEEYAMQANNPKAYDEMIAKRQAKFNKKIDKIKAHNEKVEEQNTEFRKEKLETIGNLIHAWKADQPAPQELLKYCPFEDPAYAEVLRERFKKGGKDAIADGNYYLLPVSKKELNRKRKALSEKAIKAKNAAKEVNNPQPQGANGNAQGEGKGKDAKKVIKK
jgi:hypothetical protein